MANAVNASSRCGRFLKLGERECHGGGCLASFELELHFKPILARSIRLLREVKVRIKKMRHIIHFDRID